MNSKKEVFDRIAIELGIPSFMSEKDNFIVWIIKKLSELSFNNGHLVFGGGTSLSKGYKIIRRFSEDIDFRFVSSETLTRSKRSKIKQKITDFLLSLDGFNFIEEPLAMYENTFISYKLNYPRNKEIIVNRSLRQFIKIEIYFEKLRYPVVKCPIISFYNEYEQLPAETEFECVAIEETAIDKISSFLWRIITRNRESSNDDPSIIRHLHDIALIYPNIKIDTKFRKILNDTFQHDITERAQRAETLQEAINKVISVLEEDNSYRQEYKKFVDDMSYEPENKKLLFNEAFVSFKKLLSGI